MRDALRNALEEISASFEEAERPELDHDTKGVPGMPEIVATILNKIEQAAVFVADITPISKAETGKQTANPNVLIELGYAKKALGTSRIILIWNTALWESKPEDLPFDLRHRRGPISFHLPIGAEREHLRQTRDRLSEQLAEALKDIFSSLPAEPVAALTWQASEESEPAVWKGNSPGLPVNHGMQDRGEISVEAGPAGYARLIPFRWDVAENALRILEHPTQHPIPLGRYGGLNWGPTTGGFLVYGANNSTQQSGATTTATRWFRETGELWGIDANFLASDDELLYYSEPYAAERWFAWLEQSAMVCRITGGKFPVRARLGIDGLRDARWARTSIHFNVPQALEDTVSYEFDLAVENDALLGKELHHALNKVREAFGLVSLSETDFEALMSRGLS
jgi:hypothetical protein